MFALGDAGTHPTRFLDIAVKGEYKIRPYRGTYLQYCGGSTPGTKARPVRFCAPFW